MPVAEFRSRVDFSLAAVLVATSLIALIAAVQTTLRGHVLAWLVVAILIMVGVALPVSLLARTKYRLTDNELQVFSGPFSWKFALGDIKQVTPTRSVLASPALSLDRLDIRF